MSIPPLVCCTPPPLEQCEDDKDAEDYDLQYNLSTYDDDEVSDYNYSSYDGYNNKQQASPSKTVEHVEVAAEIEKNKVLLNENIDNKNRSRLHTEEEINIEDLNLKLVSEEPTELKDVLDDSREDKYNVNSKNYKDITSIPDNIQDRKVEDNKESTPISKDNEEVSSIDGIDAEDAVGIIKNAISNEMDPDQSNEIDKQDDVVNENKMDLSPIINENEEAFDDDFDDFQFINTDVSSQKMTIIETLEVHDSPWGNDESMHSDFGNFTANFEGTNIPFKDDELQAINNGTDDIKYETIKISEDDDDFGDFDDFKSSATNSKSDEIIKNVTQQVPVLNIPSSPENENQVIESINKILSSIFKEEVIESGENFEVKLDTVLNETWGHLMETDVRQPYIVNWNNSLAQKTLLKALCIDSRNILFGPKWSYNMPKYAANLMTAPLQPLKQPTTSVPVTVVTQNETTNTDKAAPKTAWTDPFSTNGQESCSNEGENAVIEPRPTDLDVFEAAMSTKKDKIYSSTISVQPIRQISLPDTHIFTPTDSETPRSKTIHYDCGPAQSVLMSQPVMDSFNTDETKSITSSIPNVNPKHANENEYCDFQDFKGADVENVPSLINNDKSKNPLSKPNATYQTQLLEPIKLELTIPTLNWPDPGEIKETFEDFSDFMANSRNFVPESSKDSEPEQTQTNNSTGHSRSMEADTKVKASNEGFDDEFDTFQSALPSSNQCTSGMDIHFSTVEKKLESYKVIEQSFHPNDNVSEFECVFPIDTNIKADNISLKNFGMPFEDLPQPVDFNPKVQQSTSISLPNSNILQPTPSGVVGQKQQKSDQILQPLSLESYSQINWPNPGIDLQDLSRFNPVETLPSLKSDVSGSSHSKVGTPNHNQKNVNNQASEDDIWGEFVSSNPKQQTKAPTKAPELIDDDEWTDFVSSSSVKPPNGLNTISFNVHTNSNMQKSNQHFVKKNQIPLDIPALNYITPKTGNHKSYNDKHFQNL